MIGAVPEIRSTLAMRGFTPAAIEEGRALLLGCLASPDDLAPERDTASAKRQREAVAELDQLDEPTFATAGAVLRRYHPDAAAYVFDGVSAGYGATSVQAMATFLARVRLLETGGDPARASKREDDRGAVARLAERGLTEEERARLEGLVELALGPTEVLASVEPAEARRERLVAARLWYDDWSTVARTYVKKRAYRIRLGLAERRPTKAREEGALEAAELGDV